MQTYLAIAFLASVFVAASAEKCLEQAECPESKCCAGLPFFGGICRDFTPEGGKCKVVDKIVPIFGDFYIASCPCAEGLVCVQQGKKKNDGICQLPPTTAAPLESTTEVKPESSPLPQPEPSSETQPQPEPSPEPEPQPEPSPEPEVPSKEVSENPEPPQTSDSSESDESVSEGSKGSEEVASEGSNGSEEVASEGSNGSEEGASEGSNGSEEVASEGSNGSEEVASEGSNGSEEVASEEPVPVTYNENIPTNVLQYLP